MLNDAFAHFEGQIQSAKSSVALFEVFHDAQSMQVVIEKKTVLAHGGVKRLFSRMAKGRMAEVMHQRQGFGQIHVEVECSRDGAGNLRNLDGVSEPVAKVIGIAPRENLSLVFQPPKGARMDDAVAVALVVVAIRMRRLREAASAGMFHLHRVAGQHARSLAVQGRVASTCAE